MKIFLQLYLILFFCLTASGQVTISGRITDQEAKALIGANVYIKDSYDGATTNAEGHFSFEIYEQGEQILIISFIGFKTQEISIETDKSTFQEIVLEEEFNTMNAVTISAGAFEASDEKKSVILKSLDIAMTAGATADIAGALNTLPGTQKNGESGRLFVRGGTANETKAFIDGVEVSNFFGTTGPSIPSRSRFSPFLFKGTFFSTGGYSAEYGQALSSALVLKTNEVNQESSVDISLMSIGADISANKYWNNQSIYVQAAHSDLTLYNNLFSQNVHWIEGNKSWNGTLAYKKDFQDGGQLRALTMANTNSFALEQKTILNDLGYNSVFVKNQFFYSNITYEKPVNENDVFYSGLSFTNNHDQTGFNGFGSNAPINDFHFKIKYEHQFNDRTYLKTGTEFFNKKFQETINDTISYSQLSFDQFRTVFFTELDLYLSDKWILRGGIRSEYESYARTFNLAPRLSLAYKLDEFNQLSVATGIFYQDPDSKYLRFSKELDQEWANHYILNFQRIKEDRIIRVEGYFKQYNQLIRYDDAFDPETYTSDGSGYAYGLDLFLRDRGGIKNLDYWISYSWLQSERKFQNYPIKSTPGFVSNHNASIVSKKWFPRLKSQMGLTYSVTSGRPYDDPNVDGYNESKTEVYHDLSYNVAWLPNSQVVVYFSASNLLGWDQSFGYNFSDTPDDAGFYKSEVINLPAKRFVFLGCFITIGTFNKQIQNL